ncbi:MULTISPECIES: peptidylprolyl isomerase [unclassified Jeotgalibaca]|uniref:peptidylprolyl isomerase n=1 Tax=unclassified Jeotgalibaca TaxID=2621505 RepID=UPI003FD2CAAA
MKKWALSALTFAAAATLAGCADNSETVATSNGGDVTKEELYTAMKDYIGEETLQRLIIVDLLEAEVGENEYLAEADAEARSTMANYGGEEQFMYILSQSGFSSVQDYTDQLYMNKLLVDVVESRTEFTDEEVQAFYDAIEPNIQASHILVEDEALAKDIIKQLDGGADFSELAKEHSSDTTAEKGGDLGSFGRGQMVAEFEEAAFALKDGEYTKEPVQSQYGYHIIKRNGTDEKEAFDAEAVKQKMMDETLADYAKLQEVMVALVEEADIKIKDSDLEGAMDSYKASEELEEGSDAATEESATEESAE